MTLTAINRACFAAAIAFLLATPAPAQDASPEMMQAYLQAAIGQRDKALSEGILLSAQLAAAQRETARLRKELEEAKRPAPQPEPAK